MRSKALHTSLVCGFCACLWWAASAFAAPIISDMGPISPWTNMPAGARVTYIGIHGGTVPVSLLTDKDGTSMVTFVGQTGNDFLRILLRTSAHEASLPPTSERPAAELIPLAQAQTLGTGAQRTNRQHGVNATVLQAETAVGNIPVLYVTGKGFARMDLPETQWLPFGLSEKPLELEGQVVKPIGVTKIKKQRRYLLPKSLKKPT